MLYKKVILGFCLLCGLLAAPAFSQDSISVSLISGTDVTEEKQLFIKIYSGLYQDIAKELQITDMSKALEERFDAEVKRFETKENLGIRVSENNRCVAFVSIFDGKEKLRLRRCAIDPSCSMNKVVPALISFVFKTCKQAKSISTVILKNSEKEKSLLTKFGFKESSDLPDEYDKKRYASYIFEQR